jgi:hypothetical protein
MRSSSVKPPLRRPRAAAAGARRISARPRGGGRAGARRVELEGAEEPRRTQPSCRGQRIVGSSSRPAAPVVPWPSEPRPSSSCSVSRNKGACRSSAKLRHRGRVPARRSVIRLARACTSRRSSEPRDTRRRRRGTCTAIRSRTVNWEAPDESTLTRLRAKELANALSQLNKRMRCVLALRFGLDGETRRPWKKSVSGWESRASACANSSRVHYENCAPSRQISSCTWLRISPPVPELRFAHVRGSAPFGRFALVGVREAVASSSAGWQRGGAALRSSV